MGKDKWICSREQIQISPEAKIFSPANLRAAQDVDGRYGCLCQPHLTGVTSQARLAFEAAPFGFLVEKAGGKSSDGIDGASILDTKITGIDQRTALCIGSAKEVDRFNYMALGLS